MSEISHAQIQSSTFTSNSVSTPASNNGGDGGAVYFYSSDATSQLTFEPTITFTGNSASKGGGAIFWNYNQPKNITSLTYNSNTATLYGANYGCFAQVMNRITATEYATQIASRRRLSNASASLSGTTSITLSSQQSGGSLPEIHVALKDEFGQILGSDSTSTVTIAISGNYAGSSYTPTLTGTLTKSVTKGVVKFTGITFTAQPGASYSKYYLYKFWYLWYRSIILNNRNRLF